MSGRERVPRIEDINTYPRRWVHLTVAADYLEIDYRTLCAWIDEGLIEAKPFGKRFRRIDINELRRFHAKHSAA